MKKNRKTDYLIMALFCLVVLNIGSIVIGIYPLSHSLSYAKEESRNIVSASTNFIKGTFHINNRISKIIDSVFPSNIKDDQGQKEEENSLHSQVEDLDISGEMDIVIDELEEYESLIIIKDLDGKKTVENIPEPLMINKLKIDEEKPYILLYHTHATESFVPATDNNYHVADKRYNVLGLGEIMATVLEAGGHKVDHDHTYHDLPSYNKSYSKSLNTINKKREESNNLKILLDIHRNAVKEDSPNIETLKKKSKIEIDGKEVAKFSLVVGPDSENKEEVLNFAKYIKAVSDTVYPGLCSGIIIKPIGKYNQHMSDYSALFEIGYNFNHIDETTETAKLVGEILSLVLTSIKE